MNRISHSLAPAPSGNARMDKGSDNSQTAKRRPLTKAQRVFNHLQSGRSITPIEALDLYGSFRLSGIISRLRKRGYFIVTERETYPETGSTFAKYTLIQPSNEV